jgi:hypothetical protein
LPHVPGWQGNINPFPFRRCRLASALGPANRRLTNIAGEPWPLRGWGFPPHYAATTAGICIAMGSRGAHAPPSEPMARPPTGAWLSHAPPGLGGPLSPFLFQAQPPRRVSCYTLLSRWLLLGLRPRCLRGLSPSSLRGHLGTLTRGWVLSLSDAELSPAPQLPPSTDPGPSELDCTAGPFGPYRAIRSSTAQESSGEAILRNVSGGTGYTRARLAYHP